MKLFLIEEYSDEFELLLLEVTVGGKEIRVVTGYGPQENWKKEDRLSFFQSLEEEIVNAKSSENLVYIQMDAISKLGPGMIKGDPHAQSGNGKILSAIIKRNALSVINKSEDKYGGKITLRQDKKKASLIL